MEIYETAADLMEGDILFDHEGHAVEGNEDWENVGKKGQDAFLDNSKGGGKLVGCVDAVVDDSSGGKDNEDDGEVGSADDPTGGNEDDEEVLHDGGRPDDPTGGDEEVHHEGGRSDYLAGGEDEEVLHEGGCHCGAVRWRVRASPLPTGGRRDTDAIQTFPFSAVVDGFSCENISLFCSG